MIKIPENNNCFPYQTLIDTIKKSEFNNPLLIRFQSELESACHHSATKNERGGIIKSEISISFNPNAEKYYHAASVLGAHPKTYNEILKSVINNRIPSQRLLKYLEILQILEQPLNTLKNK